MKKEVNDNSLITFNLVGGSIIKRSKNKENWNFVKLKERV